MAMRFHRGPVRVQVPATCANLGPGFDALGLAVGRYDDVTAEVTGAGLHISAVGEGSDTIPTDERHLIIRSMRSAFDRMGGQPDGLRLDCVNRIPHGRGLGSSAAAIVSGIELARNLVLDGRNLLEDAAALALAAEIEGHPDNVAACLLGGLTVAWTEQGVGRATRVDPVGIRPVLFIPTDPSATETARAALPRTVAHADAAFNVGRSALLIVAVTGRPDLLLSATEDHLHQGFRAAGMPASAALVAQLRERGLAAVISGAGSSVLVLAPSQSAVADARGLAPEGWECAELDVAEGVRTGP
jgi:homoserine kinase